MRSSFAVVFVLGLFSAVNASQPGQPLASDDWVGVLPGLSVETFVGPVDGGTCNPRFLCEWEYSNTQDAGGAMYYVTAAGFASGVCPSNWCARRTIQRIRPDGTDEVVAYIDERYDPISGRWDKVALARVGVDIMNGFLYVKFIPSCDAGSPGGQCDYPSRPDVIQEIVRIRGLITVFDLLMTFSPGTEALSFRVPAAPEGLLGADHFDTYYGPLSGPKDFSRAQPIRCNYPATIPQPGDYLETGVVPDPPSIQGYYYVTSATYQGETRYGRKRENGVLSGRDPAGLPPCVEALAELAPSAPAPQVGRGPR